jgi:hypothetical protein
MNRLFGYTQLGGTPHQKKTAAREARGTLHDRKLAESKIQRPNDRT